MKKPTPDAAVQASFWAAAAGFGFLQAWAGRFDVVNDGISYIEMGEAYLRGDWSTALNGMFHPLYGWIQGLALRVLRPSAYWEYFVFQLVNLAIFLATAGCFEFFLRELLRDRRAREPLGTRAWPDWVCRGIAYVVFLWAALALVGVFDTHPDMLVAACTFAAGGLLLRIRREPLRTAPYVWLGVVLGLGYLSKAVYFVLAFVFLAVAAFLSGRRRPQPRALAALAAFLVVAGPLCVALSLKAGRPTFGETGRLNYAWHVAGLPDRHWQGEPVGSGRPLHPTRVLDRELAAFEFAGPAGVTYPLWYDISDYYEGARAAFLPRRQAQALIRNGKTIGAVFLGLGGALLTGMVLLAALRGGRAALADVGRYWFLWLPAASGLGLYALVHLEERYIASFVVVAVLTVLLGIRLENTPAARRFGVALLLVFAAMFLTPVGPGAFPKFYASALDLVRRPRVEPNAAWRIAEGLRTMGLHPGDRVATLEYANLNHVHWARLAKAQIVAEVYFRTDRRDGKNDFWVADEAARRRVLEAFWKTGARVVVSDRRPPAGLEDGWMPVDGTGYYALWAASRPAA